MKYFNIKDIRCIEDLKKIYFKAAQKVHPDHGGSEEEFKVLNSEYQALFGRFKDIHKNINDKEEAEKRGRVWEEYYTSKTSTKECAEDFIKIVEFLLTLDGLNVELCGRWLWIGGDTRKHKEVLKAMGCNWNAKKKLWSWHFKEDSTNGWKKRKTWEMNTIRAAYGSQTFYKEDEQRMIAGA